MSFFVKFTNFISGFLTVIIFQSWVQFSPTTSATFLFIVITRGGNSTGKVGLRTVPVIGDVDGVSEAPPVAVLGRDHGREEAVHDGRPVEGNDAFILCVLGKV